MKVETDRKLETNISSAVQFKISENASKLFAMLGSYLYSKKEECVLHEISANAIDAHKMVGKENEPIHVVLPTRLDSQLRIRDFGPGLSEENVYRFLTTYGESNKQESNDFIGGWGIGSKSPAAVSDTWKITSHHDGVMSEYLVFINGDGIPSLTKIRSVPTTETGLEVSIPVPDNRLTAWQTAVQSVYAYYPVLPKVTNAGYYAPKSMIPSVKDGRNWWYTHTSSVVTVVASNRGYACDADKLAREMTSDGAKSLLGLGLYLEMKVGEVDLSISREQLQFTRKTIAVIETRLVEIYNELKAKFDAAVANHTDELDYRVRVLDYMRNNFNQSHHGYRNLPFMPLFIRGAYGISVVDDLVKYRFGAALTESQLSALDIRVYNGKALKLLTPSFNCWRDYAVVTDSQYSAGKRVYDIRIQIDKLSRIKFFLADCKDAYSRVRNAFGGCHFAVVFKTLDNVPAMIESRVVKCSTLPVPARMPRSVVARTKGIDDIYVLDGGRFSRQDANVLLERDTAGKLTKSLAYVITPTFASSGEVEHANILSTIQDLGYKIIGVKKASDVPANDIISIVDAYEMHVRDLLSGPTLKNEIERLKMNILSEYHHITLMADPSIRTTSPTSKWNVFKDKYADLIAGTMVRNRDRSMYYPMIERVKTACSVLEQIAPKKPVYSVDVSVVQSLRSDLTEIREAYKMLNYLRSDIAIDHDFREVVTQFLDLAAV